MAKFGRFITGLVLVGATVGAGLCAAVLGGTAAGAATLITVNDAGDVTNVPANCLLPTEGDCTLRAAISAATTQAATRPSRCPTRAGSRAQSQCKPPLLTSNANGSLVLDSGHTITITGAGSTLAIIQMQALLQVHPRPSGGHRHDRRHLGRHRGGRRQHRFSRRRGDPQRRDPEPDGFDRHGQFLAGSSGGGVYLEGGATTLSGDTITGNTAGSGGGMTMLSGTNVISGGSVDGNHSTSFTAAAVGSTSRISTQGTRRASATSTSAVTRPTIDGGGLYVGNQSATSNNQVTLTNVTADNNSADDAGGGLYVANDGAGGGTVTMTGGSVSGNSSASNGGGIYDENNGHGSVNFTGVSVNSNTSSINAGGIYVQDDGSGDARRLGGLHRQQLDQHHHDHRAGRRGLPVEQRHPEHGQLQRRKHLRQQRLRRWRRRACAGKLPDANGGPGHFHQRDRVREQRHRGRWWVHRRCGNSSAADHRFVDHQRQQRRPRQQRWRDRGLRPHNLLQRHHAHQ